MVCFSRAKYFWRVVSWWEFYSEALRAWLGVHGQRWTWHQRLPILHHRSEVPLDRWHSHLLWKGPRRNGECLKGGGGVKVECGEWVWMCESSSGECDVCRYDAGDAWRRKWDIWWYCCQSHCQNYGDALTLQSAAHYRITFIEPVTEWRLTSKTDLSIQWPLWTAGLFLLASPSRWPRKAFRKETASDLTHTNAVHTQSLYCSVEANIPVSSLH